MKNTMKATLSAAVLVALPLLSFAEGEGKSIYGTDDRLEYHEVSTGTQRLADSVVSLWAAASVVKDAAAKTYKLTTSTFATAYNLCPGERFREQPVGAFCSGSLVGEDLIMTAGHCLKDAAINPGLGEYCGDMKIVFGFAIKNSTGSAPAAVPAKEVYSCKKALLHAFAGGTGEDYALIRLDRKVRGHEPLGVRWAGVAPKDTKIFVIGHPVGLPLKVAGGATIRDTSPANYFVADLDTFGGNSGSPVFNSSNTIEGILVRGDTDFIASPAGCNTMATYAQTGGRGEDVTKVALLSGPVLRLVGEGVLVEAVRNVDFMKDLLLEAVAARDVKEIRFD